MPNQADIGIHVPGVDWSQAKPLNPNAIKGRMFRKGPEEQERPDTDFLKDIWDMGMTRKDIFLIGYGSLGSLIGFCLNRGRISYTPIDRDTWQERNYWNSLFPLSRVGYPKAAPPQSVEDLQGMDTLLERPKLVITSTDSIESRKWTFENFKPTVGFIDVRAGKYTGTVVSGYESAHMVDSLPDPDRVEEPTCSEKGTMFHSMVIAGLAVSRAVMMLRACANDEPFEPVHEQLGFTVSPMTHVIVPSV